jgi:hypothetical protein
MKTLQYIWSAYWGTVYFGIRDIYRAGVLKLMGIACYLISILSLINAFNLNSGAISIPDNVKHQLRPIIVLFALYCLYMGGYLIHKSKRDEDI